MHNKRKKEQDGDQEQHKKRKNLVIGMVKIRQMLNMLITMKLLQKMIKQL